MKLANANTKCPRIIFMPFGLQPTELCALGIICVRREYLITFNDSSSLGKLIVYFYKFELF